MKKGIYTRAQQQRAMELQWAVAPKGEAVHMFVAKSIAAIPYLVTEGHLPNRESVKRHIDMLEAAVDAYINTR